MNIAFCDDDRIQLKQLFEISKKLIDKYNKCNFTFKYFCYNDPLKLIKDSESNPFDIVFLDIQMPEFSGFDIADRIYKKNNNVFIFFVTSFDVLVAESIKHRVFRFVRKGDKYELEQGIEKLLDELETLSSRYQFSFNDVFYSLPTDSIYFCESYRNKVLIHTEKEIFEQIVSLTKIAECLPKNFCKCHSSFLVNIKKIKEIRVKNLILNNGVELPLSRKYKSSVYDEMIKTFL